MSFAPGPPLTESAVRLVLLGSGELGREVAIEALRLGCEVLAVDPYRSAARCSPSTGTRARPRCRWLSATP